MAIKTEAPGGGDGRVLVFKARTPDEARKARTALIAAGVQPEYPDEAIDPFFSKPGALLPVRVMFKDAAKGIKAIDEAFPKPKADAAPKPEEAPVKPEERTAFVPEKEPAKPEQAWPEGREPPASLEKWSGRAVAMVLLSLMLPGVGAVPSIFGAAIGRSIVKEIDSRPDEHIRGRAQAIFAMWLGTVLSFVHVAVAVGYFVRHSHAG
jgi:hypothetical protein